MATLTDAELQYGDPTGDDVLKRRARRLPRARARRRRRPEPGRRHQRLRPGAEPALRRAQGARGDADRARGPEQPGEPRDRRPRRAGAVPVPVDEHGPPGRRARRRRRGHRHARPPAPDRRRARRRSAAPQLLQWLRDHDALAIEDDYDAEYRYDRAAIGALQGLEPSGSSTRARRARRSRPRCGSAGSSSRADLVEPIRHEKYLADLGTARIEQHAFADFIARGELDRHLRRMRARYRARRDALVEALRGGAARGDGQGHRRRAARHGRAAAAATTRPRSAARRPSSGSTCERSMTTRRPARRR